MAGPWEKYQGGDAATGPWSKYGGQQEPEGKLKTASDLKAIASARGEVSNPVDGMSFLDKFLAGMGKSGYDTARGLGQIVGAVSQDDVRDSRARDAALMDTGAGMAGNIAGHIGLTLAPGGLLKGAGVVAGAAKAPQAAGALSALGSSALVPKTIGGALGLGAGLGFIQPATSLKERAANTGVGAAATAAIPAISSVWRGAKAAVEPFYDVGQQRILGNALRRAAGDNADDVMRNLRNAQELVPGSAPTAGQAANNAGIASLERTATAIDPTATAAYQARMAAQNTARTSLLDRLSGSGGGLEKAIAKREGQAGALYNAAKAQGIDPKALEAAKPLLENLSERMPAGVMDKAKELARVAGESFDPNSVQGMHWIKKGVDDLISGGRTSGMGKESTRALMQFQNDLLSVMDDLSPAYKAAREQFAQQSKPINQMQIVDSLRERSIRPLDGQIMPGQFARNLSDRTAQSATGFGKASLENTLSPRQLEQLGALKTDLARAEFAKNAGRGAGSDTVQKLAYSNLLEGAGVPTWLQSFGPAQIGGNLMSRGADAVYGRANRELTSRLANGLLDPREAARFMEIAAQSRDPSMIANALRGLLTPVGMSAPGLLNAQKQ